MNGVLYTCDEYPFATTYEGAASTAGGPRSWEGCYMPDGPDFGADGFSRCFVPDPEQRSQGGTVSAMYTRDQVLDGDPYQVVIL